MPKLVAFDHITLDGYFTGPNGDLGWTYARAQDPEWIQFTEENAQGEGALVFGRITYEMMAGYWPTPAAAQRMPKVAERMNTLPKVVFSRTLDRADWQHTRLIKGEVVPEMKKLKEAPGPDMVILGSGSIVSQLAEAGLIDEFQLVLNPVVLGAGKPLFSSVKQMLRLKPESTRSFRNGNIFLKYRRD